MAGSSSTGPVSLPTWGPAWPGASAFRALPGRSHELGYGGEQRQKGCRMRSSKLGGGRAVGFAPTLGELDLHLIGEGRHRHLWHVLGAHHRVHEGASRTSFAVWAPNARSVRVVGDFNAWDGRIHPMRSLGSSGVWERFVPGV